LKYIKQLGRTGATHAMTFDSLTDFRKGRYFDFTVLKITLLMDSAFR
jgi:hypothetical protein